MENVESVRSDRGIWVGIALGSPLVIMGVKDMADRASETHPIELVRWIVSGALVHDLVVVPVVLLVGFFLNKLIPSSVYPLVRWATITTAILVVFSWPFIAGYGRNPRVPSLLARNYAHGLGFYVAGVWITTGALIAIRVVAQRRANKR